MPPRRDSSSPGPGSAFEYRGIVGPGLGCSFRSNMLVILLVDCDASGGLEMLWGKTICLGLLL